MCLLMLAQSNSSKRTLAKNFTDIIFFLNILDILEAPRIFETEYFVVVIVMMNLIIWLR